MTADRAMMDTGPIGRARGLRDTVGAAVREHAWFIALTLGYILFAGVVLAMTGHGASLSLTLYQSLLPELVAVVGVVFLVWRLVAVIAARPENLVHEVVADIARYALPRRAIRALPIVVLLPAFYSAFTSMKTAIPVFMPYHWDSSFAAWDRALHGGVEPWRILQPIVGHPAVTASIGFIYLFLAIVMVGCWVWQALTLRDPELRQQFFIAFVLCWSLLGNVAATLLASGGPCYYGLLTHGADPYRPLFDYLRDVRAAGFPVWSLGLQDMLWTDYVSGVLTRGGGISAMPSIHVSVATLLALLGWRTHRLFGLATTALATAILVGSIHHGWHYAIDGYAAVLGTTAIWYGVGRALRARRAIFVGDRWRLMPAGNP
jgi:hypothetical protein